MPRFESLPNFAALALALLLPLSCGGQPAISPRDVADANDTGRHLPAKNESEKTILRQVGELPTGVQRSIGDSTVVADAVYSAAVNGRKCRSLRIGPKLAAKDAPTRQRVACTEGEGWFFVPDVLGTDTVPQ